MQVQIYKDGATHDQKIQAGIEFFKQNGYLECSSLWLMEDCGQIAVCGTGGKYPDIRTAIEDGVSSYPDKIQNGVFDGEVMYTYEEYIIMSDEAHESEFKLKTLRRAIKNDLKQIIQEKDPIERERLIKILYESV